MFEMVDKLEKIYIVFCKTMDDNGSNIEHINLLNKAFVSKDQAYEYAVLKITKMLNNINEEYKTGEYNKQCILPLHAISIYVLYTQKYDIIEKYEYFLSEYIKFFNGISFPPTMFYVSEHNVIY